MTVESELETATQIAEETGRVLRSYFGSKRVAARAKGERDVVTAADLASERLMVERIREAFPGDGVVAEEGSQIRAKGSRRWFLDPLDGTVNYSRAVPIWCVSLTLFEGGEPVLGVIHDPIRRETFRAARGLGAWCNGTRVACSGVSEPNSAIVHLTVELLDGRSLHGLEDLNLLAPHLLRTRNTGSAALALAYVAAGRFDAMLHRYAHTWDYGAGVLLVQEAGGIASGIDGHPYTEATSAVLAAATPELHDSLLDLLGSSANPGVQG